MATSIWDPIPARSCSTKLEAVIAVIFGTISVNGDNLTPNKLNHIKRFLLRLLNY